MANQLRTVKKSIGYQVEVIPDNSCVNPKVKQGWHIYCPNCNQCGRY